MSWRSGVRIVERNNGKYDVICGDYWWSEVFSAWRHNSTSNKTVGLFTYWHAVKIASKIDTPPPCTDEGESSTNNVVNWRDNIRAVGRRGGHYDLVLGDYWWAESEQKWYPDTLESSCVGSYTKEKAESIKSTISLPPPGYKEVTEMNNAVSFKVGDTGKTQGGATYRIVAIINNPDFPIIAIVRAHNSDIEQSCRFRLNGVPPTYSPNSYYQLLPPTVTKYVNLYQRYRDDIKTVVFDTPEQAQGHADSYPTETTKVLKVAIPVEV